MALPSGYWDQDDLAIHSLPGIARQSEQPDAEEKHGGWFRDSFDAELVAAVDF